MSWRSISFDGSAWLFGGQLVVHGLVALIVWFTLTDPGLRSTVPVGSPLAVVAGLLAGLPAVRVTDFFPIVIGLYWAVWGVIEVGKHISQLGVHRRYRLVEASVAVLGGGCLISTWNDPVRTTAIIGGLFLVTLGLAMMPLAREVKSLG
jgi:uncharacterized membrane protein